MRKIDLRISDARKKLADRKLCQAALTRPTLFLHAGGYSYKLPQQVV